MHTRPARRGVPEKFAAGILLAMLAVLTFRTATAAADTLSIEVSPARAVAYGPVQLTASGAISAGAWLRVLTLFRGGCPATPVSPGGSLFQLTPAREVTNLPYTTSFKAPYFSGLYPLCAYLQAGSSEGSEVLAAAQTSLTVTASAGEGEAQRKYEEEAAARKAAEKATAEAETLAREKARPVLTSASQTNVAWREDNSPVTFSRKQRLPLGTTFSFSLNEPAAARLYFTQRASGRTVGKKCVAQTRRNGRLRRCTRTVTAGTLSFAAHTGVNTVRFHGRLSRKKKLKPGRYTLVITATSASGQQSAPRSLSFTIVKN